MFLIPLLLHSSFGLPLTIVLVVALIALQIFLVRRRRHRRAQAAHGGDQSPGINRPGPDGRD